MPEYHIGNKLVQDDEGMPILGENGEEFCVTPEEFEFLGMPGADAFRWSPTAFNRQSEQGGNVDGNSN